MNTSSALWTRASVCRRLLLLSTGLFLGPQAGAALTSPDISIELPAGTPLDTSLLGWRFPSIGRGFTTYPEDHFESGEPVIPPGLREVKAFAAGADQTAFLKMDGTVVVWPPKNDPTSTVPAGLADVVAIANGGDYIQALKRNGTVVEWGTLPPGTASASTLRDIIALSAGPTNPTALKSDGTVTVRGTNRYGLRDVPPYLEGVIAISASWTYIMALQFDGNVVIWSNMDWLPTTVPVEPKNPVVALVAASREFFVIRKNGVVTKYGYLGREGVWPLSGWLMEGEDVWWASAKKPKIIAASSFQSMAEYYPPLLLTSHGIPVAPDIIDTVSYGSAGYIPESIPAELTDVVALSSGLCHHVALMRRAVLESQHVGVPGSPGSFTVRNSGTAPLYISSITVDGENPADFVFSQVGPEGISVPVGGTATIPFTFTPLGAGDRSAMVSVFSNDFQQSPYLFGIHGTGIPSLLTGTDSFPREFGQGLTITKAALLANDVNVLNPASPPSLVSVDTTSLHRGTISSTDTSISYTPAPGYAGDDSFTYTIRNSTGLTTSGTVYLPLITDIPTTPAKVGFTLYPAPFVAYPVGVSERAYLEVSFSGVPGRTYQIQTSENLIHWDGKGLVTADSVGWIKFYDPAPRPRARFYRLTPP